MSSDRNDVGKARKLFARASSDGFEQAEMALTLMNEIRTEAVSDDTPRYRSVHALLQIYCGSSLKYSTHTHPAEGGGDRKAGTRTPYCRRRSAEVTRVVPSRVGPNLLARTVLHKKDLIFETAACRLLMNANMALYAWSLF